MQADKHSKGFTIVEVMVTLVIVALFMTFFFQSYMAIESQRQAIQRRANASSIAYTNLRKFAQRPLSSPTAFSCDTSMNGRDSTQPGKLLGDQTNTPASPSSYGFTAEDATSLLGAGSSQEVRVFAPYGCLEFDKMPLKIVSTVRYGTGTPQEEVVHVSFIK